jgi:4-diphosphocytidyl-2-C-methyl-D-erythritol kinase
MIVESAPAKINLALHIRRRRADGYHDLETIFAFARDGDVVTVAPAERDEFAVVGPFAAALQGSRSNLVTQAADGFRSTFGIDARHAITLDKRLPIASGIGGGSADAAATLRALAKLHGIDPQHPQLFAIAEALGADVPACLLGRPALGKGKGEQLAPLPPFGALPLLLVNPRVALATAPMFAAWDGIDRGPIASEGSVLARAGLGGNDFTAPAVQAAPVIAEMLMMLSGVRGSSFVRMSGSGASCFALFDTHEARDAAAVEATRRGWWTLATTLD